MVVRERIATARERIAKLRKAEKMVGVRGGAERQREQEAAAHAHSRRQHARCRLASPRGTDPESFTYGTKESRLEICVSGSVIWSADEKCGAREEFRPATWRFVANLSCVEDHSLSFVDVYVSR